VEPGRGRSGGACPKSWCTRPHGRRSGMASFSPPVRPGSIPAGQRSIAATAEGDRCGVSDAWDTEGAGRDAPDGRRVPRQQVPAVELREVGDALAEEYGHQGDAHFVHDAQVERPLADGRAGDRDVPPSGDLDGPRDRRPDLVDERRPRPSLVRIRGRSVVDHDDRSPSGWASFHPSAMSNKLRPQTSAPCCRPVL
jgi:hypothetical protein